MNPAKFSPKDAKIIRDNPAKSPAELLVAGLSKKAFERLKAERVLSTVVDIKPVKVESAKDIVLISRKPETKFMLLKNLRTKIVTKVSSRTANMLLSVYPKEYKTL